MVYPDQMMNIDIKDWESYMKDKYEIDFSIHYLSPMNSSSFYLEEHYLANLIRQDQTPGLIRVGHFMQDQVFDLAQQGLIVPFNEYVEDLVSYHNIPESV